MPKFEFSMSLSTEEVRSIYEGKTLFIVVKSDGGSRLRLPAVNFRNFVTSSGVHGRFSVTIDANNKIQSMHKL